MFGLCLAGALAVPAGWGGGHTWLALTGPAAAVPTGSWAGVCCCCGEGGCAFYWVAVAVVIAGTPAGPHDSPAIICKRTQLRLRKGSTLGNASFFTFSFLSPRCGEV